MSLFFDLALCLASLVLLLLSDVIDISIWVAMLPIIFLLVCSIIDIALKWIGITTIDIIIRIKKEKK